jgi:hypothetical protein
VVNRAKRRADALRKINRMPDLLRPRGLATAHQHSLFRRMQAEMVYLRDKVCYAVRMKKEYNDDEYDSPHPLFFTRLLIIWCMQYEFCQGSWSKRFWMNSAGNDDDPVFF